MDKKIAIFGEEEKINLSKKEYKSHVDYIYLGTIQDFLNMNDKSWAEMRQSILINFGAIWCRNADHQYSKLAFTCKIDEMRRENE